MKITNEVAETLKSYVYVYIDTCNGEPFYIGKGKGNRLFSHLEERSDTDKVARIAEIRSSGEEPQIDLLRYGLSDAESALVEAAAIDLVGKAKLTNLSLVTMTAASVESLRRSSSQCLQPSRSPSDRKRCSSQSTNSIGAT